MKKLFKDTKRISLFSFFFTFFLMTNSLANSPEMMVTSVKGNAFLVSKGQTKQLSAGDHIYGFDEIFTEIGGQLTVKSYKDQVFHFSGGSSAKVLKDFLELQNGYLWVESLQSNAHPYKIQTPNSVVSFSKGEAIIDFDNNIVKTQILVLNGEFSFANLLESYLNLEVTTGKFSFISKDYEDGAPRNPTPVGKTTFSKLQALFKRDSIPTETKVTPIKSILSKQDTRMLESDVSIKRSLASVVEIDDGESAEIIHRKSHKRDTKIDRMLSSYHEGKITSMQPKKVKRKFVPSYNKKTDVKITIFGQNKRSIASKKIKRKPASIGIEPVVKIKQNAFDSSLTREYKKQLRHNKEVNSLINELKSYDQDYKQSY